MAGIQIELDVEMRTRDGALLRADVYRPDARGKVPAILKRTPYDKSSRKPGLLSGLEAAAAGFAYVVQDVRGRFRSEGEWNVIDWGGIERYDGYDSVEWVASQPWCDGNVGMVGASYEAGNQIAAAREQPPSLRAIAPAAGGCGYDGIRQSQMTMETIILSWTALMALDVLQKRAAAGEDVAADLAAVQAIVTDPREAAWTLPLRDLPPLKVAGMPSYDEMMAVLSRAADGFVGEEERIRVPALVNTGWYDIGAGFELFRVLRSKAGTERARTETKTIVGPWGHNGHEHNIGEWGLGQLGGLEGAGIPRAHLDFFRRHLLGDDSAPVLSNVRYFLMGLNRWKEADDWPIPGSEVRRMFLRSGGHANSTAGDGALSLDPPTGSDSPDRYDYDPANPVPSHGLRVMYNGGPTVHGPFDQHRIECRDDVLVYTSEPFQSDTEVSGDVALTLAIVTSAPETDFVAKLCAVDPRGVSCNIADGFLRTRYLDGWNSVRRLDGGSVYVIRIAMGPTSFLFRPGWRVRVQVTSSCFPHWDRNLNTGNAPGADAAGVVARQEVHHSPEYPSWLDLPVVDPTATRFVPWALLGRAG